MDELGDKVTNDERAKVEAAISDLENAVKGGNPDDIKKNLDAMYKSMEPISQKIYQQAQQEQQTAAGAGPQPGEQRSQESSAGKDGDFVDADYKIVDDQ